MKVFAVFFICLVVASCTLAAPSVQDNKIENDSTLSRATRFLSSCFDTEDMTTCLAVRGITALNRAARSNNIELINGITFKRDPASPLQRNGRAMNENDLIVQLPENTSERSGRLLDLALDSATEFLATHNLEVKIPTEATQELARTLDEGRGKIKKMLGPLILAMGAKLFALLPILLGGLALLTTKAIVVAKIAFIFALLVGGSRLFGGIGNKFGGAIGGGHAGGYSSSSAWNAPATGGWSTGGASSAYPYARSMSNVQKLAYSGQKES